VHHSHPQTTLAETEEKIIALALSRLTWGCGRLASPSELQGIAVSSPTVQKLLIKHGLGSRYERLMKLEE
jgi:hypothetical protein